jgi:hypothetical protein
VDERWKKKCIVPGRWKRFAVRIPRNINKDVAYSISCMSLFSSQADSIEEGFQILVRATELETEILGMAPKDRRLELNFLLSSETSTSEKSDSLSTCEKTRPTSVCGRLGNVPLRELKNRVPDCYSILYSWKKQGLGANMDGHSLHGQRKQRKELKNNGVADSKPDTTCFRVAESSYSNVNHSMEDHPCRNKGLDCRTSEQVAACCLELSSATSLLSLDKNTRETCSNRGRKRRYPALSDEQRRKLRTLRNREAAERARIRKRERERLLEEQLKRLLDENKRLENELLWLQQIRASSCL